MPFRPRPLLLTLLLLSGVGNGLALCDDFVRHGADPSFPDPKDPVSGIGINIHFTDAQPGELEMLSGAGFRWIRMDLHWEKTETAPGVYDFSAFDRLLASLDQFHLRALLILDYTNPLYDDGKPTCSDTGRAAFARWAVAAATHFKNRGVMWEIWNEPNGGWFWKPKANPDDYAALALTVSKAIHDAAPDELVVGPALSGSKTDFLEVTAKADVIPYWSGITIHPYLRTSPENYGDAYDRIRQFIKAYAAPGQPIDVMCGESGYSTTWQGIDEEIQGKYLARLFLFDVLSGVPLTIWYDWRDDGLNPTDQEHHFGIVHHDYHPGAANAYDPKPAYAAARTYSDQLAGYRFKERLATQSPGDYVLIFTRGGNTCEVAWTTTPDSHEITIPAPDGDGSYLATSFDGKEKSTIASTDGTLTLTLTGGPQYLVRQ